MSAGMLQRPVLGTSTLHGQRSVLRAPLGLSRKTVTSVTTCSQRRQELKPLHVAKLASAALAASLLLSAAVPEDALAARSGGRVGGSSFRSSAPRAAPRAAPSAPRSSGPAVRNYNYYSAPPLVGGYGGYGYGGGGISIMPSFGMPLFYGGGIFNFFIVMFVASAVLGVARNLTSRGRNKDDEFDD